MAFVPTSANLKDGDKRWLLKHIRQVDDIGFKVLDIVDLAALPPDVLHHRLEAADVLVFGGGDTYHLMQWLKDSRVDTYIKDLLVSRVYVGISAGSIVTGPDLTLGSQTYLWGGDGSREKPIPSGLHLVNERVRPHLDNPDFPTINIENVRRVSRSVHEPVYALDDGSALAVMDGRSEVVGEGSFQRFN